MILICTYDSAVHTEEPRWHKPMPTVPTYWWLKTWAQGANGSISHTTLRAKSPCLYRDMFQQKIVPVIEDVSEECEGVLRFKFWLYKAR